MKRSRNRKEIESFPGDFLVIKQETNYCNNCNQDKNCNIDINQSGEITSVSES
jgi:hypothetical protein